MCMTTRQRAPMSQFEIRVFLSSVPLKKIGTNGIPDSVASGCLVDYRGVRVLLTVSHAVGDQGNWGIETRYDPGKGTQIYGLGAMHFLMKGSVTSPQLKNIDFSYVAVPNTVVAHRQEIVPPGVVKSESAITVHTTDFSTAPAPNATYGFCGLVQPAIENHFGTTYVSGELKTYTGLSFLRTEDDYHVFQLPSAHPGHDHFKGCSGAPVIDEAGNIVGLVCSGDIPNNEIWAVNIGRFKAALDILVSEHGAKAT